MTNVRYGWIHDIKDNDYKRILDKDQELIIVRYISDKKVEMSLSKNGENLVLCLKYETYTIKNTIYPDKLQLMDRLDVKSCIKTASYKEMIKLMKYSNDDYYISESFARINKYCGREILDILLKDPKPLVEILDVVNYSLDVINQHFGICTQ